jgi:uncharacterized protein YjbI with pentapeptide repeats
MLLVFFVLLLLDVSGLFGATTSGWAGCSVDLGPPGHTGPLIRHVGKDCSQPERESAAVSATEVLQALRDGRALDFEGVIVIGPIELDTLPTVAVEQVEGLSSWVRTVFSERKITSVRRVSGPLRIVNSTLRGQCVTRSQEIPFVVQGGIDMQGTHFEGGVDLSLSVIAGAVDFSNAVFDREGFFVQSLFEQPVKFQHTAFGTHTRFHRAIFHDTVSFQEAKFTGLSEMLEVVYQQGANFSGAFFNMGAGFSGSEFRGRLDFSGATFQREVFFLFSLFEKEASFKNATFRGEADFSDANFNASDEFTGTIFAVEPRFSRTKFSGTRPTGLGKQDPWLLYGMAGVLFIFAGWLIYLVRRKQA